MKSVLLLVPAALVLSACEDLDYYDYGRPSSYYATPYYGGPYEGNYRHHYRDRYYNGGYGGYYGPYYGR